MTDTDAPEIESAHLTSPLLTVIRDLGYGCHTYSVGLSMARRPRKRHIQIGFEFKTWGGKRKGAGRKPSGFRSSVPHVARPRFDSLTALHVTLRLTPGRESLRQRDAYFALQKATGAVQRRSDFRIVHISLEVNHLHLVVEAANDVALARGLQAFEVSAASHLNRAFRRSGEVFEDRYHSEVLGSPTQARHAISYVLNNWRHHDHDDGWGDERFWDVDYFSSAVSFDGWNELATTSFQYEVPVEKRLCVSPPKTWLLRIGWRKAGPISWLDVPGRKRR